MPEDLVSSLASAFIVSDDFRAIIVYIVAA